MRMQACSCMCMILPKNPNIILSISASYLICNAFILDLSLYVYGFKLLFHMFNCLFVFYMLELGFILHFFILMPWTRIHMFMHDAIGAEM